MRGVSVWSTGAVQPCGLSFPAEDGIRDLIVTGVQTCALPITPVTIRSRMPSSAWSDRKSTRLNSSHDQISYAVFCLKKKKYNTRHTIDNRDIPTNMSSKNLHL